MDLISMLDRQSWFLWSHSIGCSIHPHTLLQVYLDVQLVKQLRNLAQHSGNSLFVTVLAAYKVLLRRYSGRDDLGVGTPSAGRSRPDLQGNLVGCFVNLIALRTSLAGKTLCCAALHCAVLRLEVKLFEAEDSSKLT